MENKLSKSLTQNKVHKYKVYPFLFTKGVGNVDFLLKLEAFLLSHVFALVLESQLHYSVKFSKACYNSLKTGDYYY
jgi:hypothetical protein